MSRIPKFPPFGTLPDEQRVQFLDALIKVYKHLLSPESSEGNKPSPEWLEKVEVFVQKFKKEYGDTNEQ